ncbi:MAG: sigma-54-dependent Fis family transcriptional regulator [Syntrophaceae bacterium]|nr:sigma-54-dependent Fis family transcriptional regulator [Syntrophaceae bacterium]
MTVKHVTRERIDRYILDAEGKEKLLSSIYKISSLLTKPVTLDRILTEIVKETSRVFGLTRVAIFLKDEESNLLECKYLIGFKPTERERALTRPFRLDRHDCIETSVVKTGTTIFIKDHANDGRITDIDLKISRIHKRVSTLAVPLMIKKDVIGLIEADRNDVKMDLTKSEIKSFSIFANQASIIIENAKLQERNKKRIQQLLSWQEVETDMVCESGEMKKVLAQALKIARSYDTTVLIEGETGTGKEIIARMLHYHSSRVGKPYIRINCGAISKDLVESEFFGYDRGTFTGGLQEGKKGLFELADGGTLLLDEISELLPSIQVKLLRFLEEREFYPVGGSKTKKVDVRIIAATNRKLEDAISEGKFRKDLYYRLNIVKLWLPPLRERKEDTVPIALFFMNKFNKKYGKRFQEISEGARRILVDAPWTGNIRELKNAIDRVVLMEEGSIIEPRHLAFVVNSHNDSGWSGEVPVGRFRNYQGEAADNHEPSEPSYRDRLFMEALRHFIRQNAYYEQGPGLPERKTAHDAPPPAYVGKALPVNAFATGKDNDEQNRNLLIQALDICEGNKSRAARMLGISRPTAVYRIRKYGIGRRKKGG